MRNGSASAVLASALVLAIGMAMPAFANPAGTPGDGTPGDGQPLTGKVFSGHSAFPRGFGYSHTNTRTGQGNLRAFARCATNPKPRRCR